LYSASKDGSIIKWNLQSANKTIFSYGKPKDPNGHSGEILSMDISFDGKY